MKLRIHLTNGKRKTSAREYEYDITYCGESFSSFGGGFAHSVYLARGLQKLLDQGAEESLCPDCLAADEYAMDMLAGDNQ